MEKRARLTQERLKQVLDYSLDAGTFTWRVGRWLGRMAGTRHHSGYNQIHVDGSIYLTARLACLYVTGDWPVAEIDHRNLDKADDRWENLRPASHSQNQCNTQPRGKSGLKNIFRLNGLKCWRVRTVKHPTMTFKCLGQALKYRNAVMHRQYGEFARVS